MTCYRWTLEDGGGVTVRASRPADREGSEADQFKLRFDSLEALEDLLPALAEVIEASEGTEGQVEL